MGYSVTGRLSELLDLGREARRHGDRAAALGHFQAAVAAAPEDTEARLLMADELRELGRVEAAEAAYHGVLQRQPGRVQAIRGLLLCARSRGDRVGALSFAEQAVAADPKDVWSLLRMAEELRELGRLDEAEAAYRRVLRRDPDQSQAFRGLAICARRRGDRLRALSYAEQAVVAEPGELGAWLQMAEELRELGRLHEAEAAYHTVLKRHPHTWPAMIGLGRCASSRGDHAAALSLYQAVLRGPWDDGTVPCEVGSDLLALGLLTEAEGAFRLVPAQDPAHPKATMGLGRCARARGDHEAALALFTAAKAVSPGDRQACQEVASAARDLGRLEAAEAEYLLLLSRDPDFHPALIGLAQCARLRGDRAATFAWLARAVDAAPGEAEPRLELARCQLETGEAAQAAQVLDDLPTPLQGSTRVLLLRAEVERSLGRGNSALRYLQAACSSDPGHAGAVIALAAEHLRRGDAAACEALLREAVERFPGHQGALRELSQHLLRTWQYEACAALLPLLRDSGAAPRAIRLLESQLAEALTGRGAALSVMEGAEAALAGDSAVLRRTIVLRRELGDLRGMARDLERARAIMRAEFQTWSAVVQGDLHLGRLDQAAASLDAIPAITPQEQAEGLWLRGALAELRFQLAKAAACYQASLDLVPTNSGTWHRLARVALMQGDTATTSRALRQKTTVERAMKLARGENLNPSQSLPGQLLNEALLNPGLAEANRALRSLDPAARLPAYARLLSENGDSTFLALAHVVTLREAGLTGIPATGARPAAIPRTICQYWSDTPPPEIQAAVDSWRTLNPGFRHILFNDASAASYLAQHGSADTLRAFKAAAEPALRSDLFRLAWLVRNGGFYVDADDRCVGPIEDALDLGGELILHQEDIGTIGNNFLACVPGHPLMRRALGLAVAALSRGDAEIIWLSTGPGLLTRCFAAEYQGGGLAELRSRLAGVRVLGLPELPSFIAMHCRLDYKRSRRNWSHTAFHTRLGSRAADEKGRMPLSVLGIAATRAD